MRCTCSGDVLSLDEEHPLPCELHAPAALDPPPFDALQALVATGRALWSATLVGNPAPVVRSVGAWMHRLVPGGLVMETTTSWQADDMWWSRVGILEKLETRRVCVHEHRDPNLETCPACPQDMTEDRDPERLGRFTEHYVWIRSPRGRRRWYNCSFIRIPMSMADVLEAEGR